MKNSQSWLRPARSFLMICSLSTMALAAGAQASSSSNDSNAGQTATPPAGQNGGVTAAPGTAAIRNPTVAHQITPNRFPTYDEKVEMYLGLSLMNGQAGQNLPKRYNLGGGEAMVTYWLGSHLGIAGDYRFEAGTSDLIPTATLPNTRALVYQNIGSGGVNYRGPKNRYAAVDFHALAGFTHGQYDHSINNDPLIPNGTPPSNYGLYNNSTSPWGAIGGSIDFNAKPRLAVRLSPDLIFEHFGTETREFFSISGGVVWRYGKRGR